MHLQTEISGNNDRNEQTSIKASVIKTKGHGHNIRMPILQNKRRLPTISRIPNAFILRMFINTMILDGNKGLGTATIEREVKKKTGC